MSVWSKYKTADGLFTGVTISCRGDHLDINIAAGLGCVMGEYDALSQRIDVITGQVVDYQPPQPSSDHAWDAEGKRWRYIKTDADIAAEVRARRDKALTACDWLVVRAIDGPAMPGAWKSYREALRAISDQSGFPRDITWPSPPPQ